MRGKAGFGAREGARARGVLQVVRHLQLHLLAEDIDAVAQVLGRLDTPTARRLPPALVTNLRPALNERAVRRLAPDARQALLAE